MHKHAAGAVINDLDRVEFNTLSFYHWGLCSETLRLQGCPQRWPRTHSEGCLDDNMLRKKSA